ncbi:MAG: Rha family transcriptional regulator [Spirochaetia bacterium]|jgi:phage regulator Rha-like protein|nr:Rha family transcriptional regulator [Spirochaetia bacterium]
MGKDVIIIKGKKCFIDSEGLAFLSNNEHRSIVRLIKNHTTTLEEFGVMGFEITKPDSKGGRPKTTYLLNEEQATLLTTFMKNSTKVVLFKKKLVKEFFRMREYIQKQELIRLTGIETRKTLTDKIKESGENERMHGHGYSTYTKLIYSLTGLSETYKEWKIDHPDKKVSFRDYLVPEDL